MICPYNSSYPTLLFSLPRIRSIPIYRKIQRMYFCPLFDKVCDKKQEKIPGTQRCYIYIYHFVSLAWIIYASWNNIIIRANCKTLFGLISVQNPHIRQSYVKHIESTLYTFKKGQQIHEFCPQNSART